MAESHRPQRVGRGTFCDLRIWVPDGHFSECERDGENEREDEADGEGMNTGDGEREDMDRQSTCTYVTSCFVNGDNVGRWLLRMTLSVRVRV